MDCKLETKTEEELIKENIPLIYMAIKKLHLKPEMEDEF